MAVKYVEVRRLRISVPASARQPQWFYALVLHPGGRWLLSDELLLNADRKWQAPFRRSTYGSRVVLRQPNTLAAIRVLPAIARVLALSPDGGQLLGLDRQGWATVWETNGWTRVRRIAPASVEEPGGAFSSRGREVGIVEKHERVGLWDIPTGRRISIVATARELFGFLGAGKTCLVSSGRGWGTTVYAARTSSGAAVRNLGPELGYAWQLALSNDGANLATVARGDELVLWRTVGWQEL